MKAFPHMAKVHVLDGNSIIREEITSGGMDLRDYFAAKAMQAIISKQPHLDRPIIFISEDRVNNVAAGAYLYADAMLNEKINWEE